MKIEDLLFAMCDDSNDYLDDAHSSIKCGSHESDEGCCIISAQLLSSTSTPSSSAPETPSSDTEKVNLLGLGLGESGGESMRRVKSTPNLLQLPTPHRHRKRSDDSAVGSAEETESYRSNESLPTGGDASPSKKIYSSYRHSCPQDTSSTTSSASSTASSSYQNSSTTPSHLRILTPSLPLYVTQPSSSIATTCPDKFRRSISTTACSGGGGYNTKRISLANSLHINPGNPSGGSTSSTCNLSASPCSSVAVTPTTPLSGFSPLGPLGPDGKLLRPPSVVISDHDLCQEEGEKYITLEELDAEFSSQHSRRRFSDCSTCSSLSFSESDLTALSNEEESEEAAVQRVSISLNFVCNKTLAIKRAHCSSLMYYEDGTVNIN